MLHTHDKVGRYLPTCHLLHQISTISYRSILYFPTESHRCQPPGSDNTIVSLKRLDRRKLIKDGQELHPRMAKYPVCAFFALATISALQATAFTPFANPGWNAPTRSASKNFPNSVVSSSLRMSNAGSTTATSPRKKRSVRDRSTQEALTLIRDITQAALDAGPRAAPSRTLQAYLAISRTLQDFSPIQLNGGKPEQFSAPVALRKLFERLGATYIKLGQFIASSPSLFPKEYVLEFQKCLDSTEPLDWNIVKTIIERETGPITKNFSFIDKKPLASASIAQVHAAKLITGEDVVIKVQKPQIDDLLKADLNFIYVASRVVEFLQPDFERTSLSAVAGDVRSSMLEELDFEKEASNIEEFREFLRMQGFTDAVTAPRVYRK